MVFPCASSLLQSLCDVWLSLCVNSELLLLTAVQPAKSNSCGNDTSNLSNNCWTNKSINFTWVNSCCYFTHYTGTVCAVVTLQPVRKHFHLQLQHSVCLYHFYSHDSAHIVISICKSASGLVNKHSWMPGQEIKRCCMGSN